MQGMTKLLRAGSSDYVTNLGTVTSGQSTTHIYDIADCLPEVARFLPLSSCLRSRSVSKAFSQAFGWNVDEIGHVLGDDGNALLQSVRRSGVCYPAASSLLFVANTYEDMPMMQDVLGRLWLAGRKELGGPSTSSPTGDSSDAPATASPKRGSSGASRCRSRRGQRGPAAASCVLGPEVVMPRVTRLALRCNISRSEMTKKRQLYQEKHSQSPQDPLLAVLGLPPGLMALLNRGPRGGRGGEEQPLLRLDFLERMQALSSLRVAVPLDLSSLERVAGLSRLTRLDLLPINRLTSEDIAPLGCLRQLAHLEMYLDDAPTCHWHRRSDGYTEPDMTSVPSPGPMMLFQTSLLREYEYARTVYPAWVRLNQILSRLGDLTTLTIVGAANYWLPMGQHLLAAYPRLRHLSLSSTSTPAEFTATPLPGDADNKQTAQSSAACGGCGFDAGLASGSGLAGHSGRSAGTGDSGGRPSGWRLRVMVRHVEGHSLMQDAEMLLPVQPLAPQDVVTLEVCAMGKVGLTFGEEVRQVVSALPVRCLVLLHATWAESRVPAELLRALQRPDPEAVDGAATGAKPGLRKLQVWSKDKEAYEVSNRVLSVPEADDSDPDASVAGPGPSSSAAAGLLSELRELVVHGPLPDTLAALLPRSLRRLSLASRPAEDDAEEGSLAARRRSSILEMNGLPAGLTVLDMQNIALLGTVGSPGLARLSQLSLHCCHLVDLSQLGLGGQLRNLILIRNTMTRSSMRQLVARCPGLVGLTLQESFSPEPNLGRLCMSATSAGLLADLQHIVGLSSLESLALPVPDCREGMRDMIPHLQALPKLQSLMVMGVWDSCVPSLAGLTALRRLEWLKLHMVVDTRREAGAAAAAEIRAAKEGQEVGTEAGASRSEPVRGRAAGRGAKSPAASAAGASGVRTRAATKAEGEAAKAAAEMASQQRRAGASPAGPGAAGDPGRAAQRGEKRTRCGPAQPVRQREERELRAKRRRCMGSADGAAAAADDGAGPSGAASAVPTTTTGGSPARTMTTRAAAAAAAASATAARTSGIAEAGPSGATGVPSPARPSGRAGGGGSEPWPAHVTNAQISSRHLYDNLTRHLPHTRINMKLITIQYKVEDEGEEGKAARRVGQAGQAGAAAQAAQPQGAPQLPAFLDMLDGADPAAAGPHGEVAEHGQAQGQGHGQAAGPEQGQAAGAGAVVAAGGPGQGMEIQFALPNGMMAQVQFNVNAHEEEGEGEGAGGQGEGGGQGGEGEGGGEEGPEDFDAGVLHALVQQLPAQVLMGLALAALNVAGGPQPAGAAGAAQQEGAGAAGAAAPEPAGGQQQQQGQGQQQGVGGAAAAGGPQEQQEEGGPAPGGGEGAFGGGCNIM